MICNKSQWLNARKEIKALEKGIEHLEGSDLLFDKLQKKTWEDRVCDLEGEVAYYSTLRSGIHKLEFDLNDIHKSIISLRIASGLSQKQLAEELGLPPQQIQRYEQDGYSKVKFERIIQILKILAKSCELKFVLNRTYENMVFEDEDRKRIDKYKSLVQERKIIMEVAL